jgi:hypothetical protein
MVSYEKRISILMNVSTIALQLTGLLFLFNSNISKRIASIYQIAHLSLNKPTNIWVGIVTFLNSDKGLIVKNAFYLIYILLLIALFLISWKYQNNEKYQLYLSIANFTLTIVTLFLFATIFSHFVQFLADFGPTYWPYFKSLINMTIMLM